MKFFLPFIIVLTISGCKTVGEQAPENQNPRYLPTEDHSGAPTAASYTPCPLRREMTCIS